MSVNNFKFFNQVIFLFVVILLYSTIGCTGRSFKNLTTKTTTTKQHYYSKQHWRVFERRRTIEIDVEATRRDRSLKSSTQSERPPHTWSLTDGTVPQQHRKPHLQIFHSIPFLPYLRYYLHYPKPSCFSFCEQRWCQCCS